MTINELVEDGERNLLLELNTETARNYKNVIDHVQQMFFEGYTPYKMCMGVKGKIPQHMYQGKALGYQDSHGICDRCYEVIKKK